MGERLIIDNRTGLSMVEIMPLVVGVLEKGRKSNNGKQYCYAVVYTLQDKSKIHVSSYFNKKSDRLTLIREPEEK